VIRCIAGFVVLGKTVNQEDGESGGPALGYEPLEKELPVRPKPPLETPLGAPAGREPDEKLEWFGDECVIEPPPDMEGACTPEFPPKKRPPPPQSHNHGK